MGASSLKGIQVKWIYEECVTDDIFYKMCSYSYYIILLSFVYNLKGVLRTLKVTQLKRKVDSFYIKCSL